MGKLQDLDNEVKLRSIYEKRARNDSKFFDNDEKQNHSNNLRLTIPGVLEMSFIFDKGTTNGEGIYTFGEVTTTFLDTVKIKNTFHDESLIRDYPDYDGYKCKRKIEFLGEKAEIYKKAYFEAFGEEGYIENPEEDLTSLDIMKKILDRMKEFLPDDEKVEINLGWEKITPILERANRQDLKGPSTEESMAFKIRSLEEENKRLTKAGEKANVIIANAEEQANTILKNANEESDRIRGTARAEGIVKGTAEGKAEVILIVGEEMTELKSENENLKSENENLKSKNENLKSENARLKGIIETLKKMLVRAKNWIQKQLIKDKEAKEILDSSVPTIDDVNSNEER